MEKKEEEKILRECLNGDEESMRTLVLEYQRKIFNYFFRNINNRETASELSQEVFLKVFSKLHTYKFKYRFSTWIYSISHNLLIDYFRKKKDIVFSKYSANEDGSIEFPDSNQISMEDKIISKRTKKKLWESISELPREYREIITMRYISNLKYKQISKILNMPMGTLKNKIYRIKKKLMEIMGENDE